MAVAGGSSPSLLLKVETLRDLTGSPVDVIVIYHNENRLTHVQVGTGEFNAKGEEKQATVPTNAVELDITKAIQDLKRGRSVWVRSKEFVLVKKGVGINSTPVQLLTLRYTKGVNINVDNMTKAGEIKAFLRCVAKGVRFESVKFTTCKDHPFVKGLKSESQTAYHFGGEDPTPEEVETMIRLFVKDHAFTRVPSIVSSVTIYQSIDYLGYSVFVSFGVGDFPGVAGAFFTFGPFVRNEDAVHPTKRGTDRQHGTAIVTIEQLLKTIARMFEVGVVINAVEEGHRTLDEVRATLEEGYQTTLTRFGCEVEGDE